ncbi:MAG TPA: bifunctional hydroxymethylpyrimidine kinase/phosphomethylpyrimidine kinase [Bryobacteraceae bacterium]|nr:bifunctional hydroxymethylpyrimidine kinase/phosphomethylpyrimidine kinase [Bryobacteraceae bacterium]
MPVALTIAGSDPSGGAGLQADLKTFHRFGVYGEAVVTLITVQNTVSLDRVETLPADLVLAQIRAVLADIPPGAAKTGALGDASVIEVVAVQEFQFPLVVDPVMISKHGARLGDLSSLKKLIARAYLLTPNLDEASELVGFPVNDRDSMLHAAEELMMMGARNVLVKGGHLKGDALDLLYLEGGEVREFSAPRINTRHTHGTGCTYSAAITAELAKGTGLSQAVSIAKTFVTNAIRSNPGLGQGSGPLNHFA